MDLLCVLTDENVTEFDAAAIRWHAANITSRKPD